MIRRLQMRIAEICNYLESGIAIIRFLSKLYDTDGKLIGPNIIYTDGCWLWPSYFPFYLRKYSQIQIPAVFRSHISSSRGKEINLSQEERWYIEYITSKVLGIKFPVGYKLPGPIDDIIKKREDKIACD